MLKNHRHTTAMVMLACIAMALPAPVLAQKKVTVEDRQAARAFSTIKDGHLFLSLMVDGGIYEFEPIGGSLAAA